MAMSEISREATRLATEQRLDEALALLRSGFAAATGPAAARLAKHAAVLCAHAGRKAEAADYYEHAVRLDPDDAYTRWALGDAYDVLGDTALAKAHWAQFATMVGDSASPELQELLALNLDRMRDRGW
jgi:tetratricopeptide (TPR) repeat protein